MMEHIGAFFNINFRGRSCQDKCCSVAARCMSRLRSLTDPRLSSGVLFMFPRQELPRGSWRTLLCLFVVHLSLCVVMGISEWCSLPAKGRQLQ